MRLHRKEGTNLAQEDLVEERSPSLRLLVCVFDDFQLPAMEREEAGIFERFFEHSLRNLEKTLTRPRRGRNLEKILSRPRDREESREDSLQRGNRKESREDSLQRGNRKESREDSLRRRDGMGRNLEKIPYGVGTGWEGISRRFPPTSGRDGKESREDSLRRRSELDPHNRGIDRFVPTGHDSSSIHTIEESIVSSRPATIRARSQSIVLIDGFEPHDIRSPSRSRF
jgi:hypothetical protein